VHPPAVLCRAGVGVLGQVLPVGNKMVRRRVGMGRDRTPGRGIAGVIRP